MNTSREMQPNETFNCSRLHRFSLLASVGKTVKAAQSERILSNTEPPETPRRCAVGYGKTLRMATSTTLDLAQMSKQAGQDFCKS